MDRMTHEQATVLAQQVTRRTGRPAKPVEHDLRRQEAERWLVRILDTGENIANASAIDYLAPISMRPVIP